MRPYATSVWGLTLLVYAASLNECTFADNVLHDLAFESTDTGAFQTGRR